MFKPMTSKYPVNSAELESFPTGVTFSPHLHEAFYPYAGLEAGAPASSGIRA